MRRSSPDPTLSAPLPDLPRLRLLAHPHRAAPGAALQDWAGRPRAAANPGAADAGAALAEAA